MAGGRDLKPRSPRWLNGLICTGGIAATACFIWRLLTEDSDAHGMALGATQLFCRILSAAILPALLLLATIGRAARRLAEGV